MIIKPYGDTSNDGAVQLSFTLPVPDCAKSTEAAFQFVKKLGFEEAQIVYSAPLSENFTFYVAYGRTQVGIDYDNIEVEEVEPSMDYYEINDYIEKNIGRKIIVVGACTGTDAHTVGIDAIMNMKGYDGHYGLERYKYFEAYNLGAQIPNEKLIEFAKEKNADAIIISQVVTQKDVHIHNLTNFIELIEAENLRDRFILVVGGPRISNKLALELGFDAGFGRGTYAENVGEFIAKKLYEKIQKQSLIK
ncbi:MAG TPA: OAM dimerization domain-containing protein [Ignavibacteriales bacterium]|nr:OAM dimerization domain-containing protein [Ignavibacteriales bacterium]HOL82040.1 OAM dimerization domain-containing protein [Ignavibacteriales bacterium]HOM66080.1 OAM dimerization domain-containing protein [Ignavibacteriales bacterium]HPD67702.1 OAM dimerization domain-containing protein [Ignavibacteriales bacterium]HPP34175.1 OAM dimerization domain-containing protein [Ignavibacteriales bacterium]